MKKLQLKDEKKKVINLFRLSVDNPNYFFNNPDRIFFISEFSYDNNNAFPFIFLRFNNENKLFYGRAGTTHPEMRQMIHEYLMSEGYKVTDIDPNCKMNPEGIRKGYYIDMADHEFMAKGRYFVVDVPIINQKCVVFSFWFANKTPKELINDIVDQVCKGKKLFDRRIYITNGSKPLICYNDFNPGPSEDELEDNTENAILHMLPGDKKWKQTANFRNMRDKQIGKKLTMSNGKEMPVAQYNALKYVDESEIKPKRIVYMTENQVAEIKQRLQQARQNTNINPTEKQKEAGNYKMGRVKVLDYEIAIENPKGTYRRGKDKDGHEWKTLMNYDYGYFTHTKGYDGDAIDVFLGSHFDTYSIFAIDQRTKDGNFDETKIMLGFRNEKEAREAYLSCYEKGWKGLWKITEVPHTVFQKWLYDGYQQRKPFFEYAEIQKKKLNENTDFYKKDKLKLSGESLSDYAHIIDEVIQECKNNKTEKVLTRESIDELLDTNELQDVITSFDVQKELNPKFWINGKLNSRVRLRLLDIADIFFDSLDVNWVKPKDIIMTGSLANYNWSKYSDVDLHIIVDFKEVDERTEFVKNYFDSKKKLWNEEHEDLTIYGYPVELYVQDVNEEHSASGIYSLEKNKWLKEPVQDELEAVELDKHTIADKTKKIADKIETLETACKKEEDTEKLDILSDKVKKLFDKIKGMRKDALKHGGSELNTGNLIFKCLRRTGYIGRLVDLKRVTFDKINTIK